MKKRITPFILVCLCLWILGVLASFAFGARNVGLDVVVDSLLRAKHETLDQLVVQERMPRTVFGLLAGAALGVSGALMQAITRNPIADPSILGVNTGASLFVVSGIAFFHIGTPSEYILFAMVGAALTAAFVYGVGSMGAGGATPIKLALAGAATSAALSSLVSAVMLPRTEVMNAFRFWQVGSISGATREGMTALLPFLMVGLIAAFLLMPSLDILALGEDVAVGLGVKTGPIRLIGAISGVLLCGAITALAGPIGFIGLMVPHMVRLLCGPSMKVVLPLSALVGSMLLLYADVIGRLLGSPGELESGIVTAFIGAPVLIFIAMRTKIPHR